LRQRACALPPPDGALRFHGRAFHWISGARGPALVALASDAIDRTPRTLHLTFIAANGRGKAELTPPRLLLPKHNKAGAVVRLWPDDLLTTLLQTGESSLCFDGQNFFDPNHPIDKRNPALGTQSNYFTGKPLTPDNYAFVRTQMMSCKGEDGKPLYVNPNLLVVPPQLEQPARLILNADMIPNAAGTAPQTNIYKGSAELLVVPQLSAQPTQWYLLDTSRPVRPFVFQLREPPQFTYLNNPTDLNVFQRREYLFGVHARGNAGYALWFLGAKATA